MKSVSGTLKLDLAQFRELEAFATFGSELDAVSKAQLERGDAPRRAAEAGPARADGRCEEQIVSIFAGTNGYLDDIPTSDVQRFETELLDFVRTRHADLMNDDPRHRRAARRRRAGRPRSPTSRPCFVPTARGESAVSDGRWSGAHSSAADQVGESTKKITRAMELIAASRIVKAQARVHAAQPYAEGITDVVRNLQARGRRRRTARCSRRAPRSARSASIVHRRRPRSVRWVQLHA